MNVVTIFDTRDYVVHVHKVGCRDIARTVARTGNPHSAATIDVASIRGVVEDAFADFIFANDRQPWTDYTEYVNVAPCVKLPREVIYGTNP